jgi:hypothetical protein
MTEVSMMRREASRVSFLMCPFCVRSPSSESATYRPGVFEAAGLAVTSAYGIARSTAFAYVLVLHVLNFFPYIAAGLVLLGAEARTRKVLARAGAARVRSGAPDG